MTTVHGNQKVTDEELIQEIREISEPVASAAEIAKSLSMSRTGVTLRLKDLEEAGEIERKEVGNGYVWWVVD